MTTALQFLRAQALSRSEAFLALTYRNGCRTKHWEGRSKERNISAVHHCVDWNLFFLATDDPTWKINSKRCINKINQIACLFFQLYLRRVRFVQHIPHNLAASKWRDSYWGYFSPPLSQSRPTKENPHRKRHRHNFVAFVLPTPIGDERQTARIITGIDSISFYCTST